MAGFLPSLPESLRNGRIGRILRVSCGVFEDSKKFDGSKVFESAWSYVPDGRPEFVELAYLGDARPPKFRVSLPGDSQRGREWMDFHDSNLRGIIFEATGDWNHRVVYFVVDKPPQFYRAEAPGHKSGKSRISHPSSLEVDPEYVDISVCRVPWIIQYSRVFKVEYQQVQDFNPRSFTPRLGKERKELLSWFEAPRIETSRRRTKDIANTVRTNLSRIATIIPRYCQVGVAQLLYNCNIAATSDKTTIFLENLISSIKKTDKLHLRIYAESVNKMGRDMNTCQVRALRQLHFTNFANFSNFTITRRLPLPIPSPPEYAFAQQFDSRHLEIEETRGDREPVSLGLFQVLVYPSHVEIEGPVDLVRNSVTDQYRDALERFIRVKFADNNGKPLKVEPGVDLGDILGQRVAGVLTGHTQVSPLLSDFEFLGYSMSSLKKRKAVWFFQRKEDGTDAKKIRDKIGDWDVAKKANQKLAHHPSKWGARVSLAFTESILVRQLSPDEWTLRPDSGKHPDFPNTDGCGLISSELCDTINQRLAPYGFAASRAFQIRFGGVKGVVYAGAKSLLTYQNMQCQMLLRESQLKFQVPGTGNLGLRIVSTSGESPQSLFFASALKAFEDSGADTARILDFYAEAYTNLTKLSSTGLNYLQQIFRIPQHDRDAGVEMRYIFLKLAVEFKKHGILPEHYQKSFLAQYLTKLAAKSRDKDLFRIPIPDSFSVLGLTDDYQVLEPNEVFIRAGGTTIAGPVLLYRDPIIHIGDIQEARAVGDRELHRRMKSPDRPDGEDQFDALKRMDNVIFFSQRDDPPLPNRLSGGDLDGDRFEVIMKDCRFWGSKYCTSEPDSYTEDSAPAAPTAGDIPHPPTNAAPSDDVTFDISRVATFIAQYIRNDCFAELQNRHLALADQKPGGMNHPYVKDMAEYLSRAVDYAKSGDAVNLVADVVNDPRFGILDRKPDFLRAIRRSGEEDEDSGEEEEEEGAEYYKSEGLLGEIYRRFAFIEYDVPHDADLDNRGFRDMIGEKWIDETRSLWALAHADVLRELVIAVKTRASQEMRRYREDNHDRDDGDLYETYLFFRKQRDDFPADWIAALMKMVLGEMEKRGVVGLVSDSPLKARACEGYNRDTVVRIYKQCLLQAWDTLENNAGGAQIRAEGNINGYGYALLYLYTLYCIEAPIEEGR
ncbi:RNA dependent RNA polymerase-domain-containing protein [Lasiosphaeria ovina]|uniref:RNA-dependent RNA polymerase n=1 Tax=Lasiosphaeria ovina TaxID=92902 RepID=A0AAE0MXT4_9PEZI|nr:RNA dependent RNA polymerase-domain-containing protein [Lasiosphaeria ovina]